MGKVIERYVIPVTNSGKFVLEVPKGSDVHDFGIEDNDFSIWFACPRDVISENRYFRLAGMDEHIDAPDGYHFELIGRFEVDRAEWTQLLYEVKASDLSKSLV